MENKYTLGPWRLNPIYNDEIRLWGYRLLPLNIEIKAMEHDREAQANAQLIAAAPELLEACKAVMQMYEDDSIFRHPRNCDAIKRMEQAITKATNHNQT